MSRTCIIVEDEVPIADRLEMLIHDVSDLKVLAKLNSVKSVSDWFVRNEVPDLIFLDIQLSDGTGLDVLAELDEFPSVIFTTAYDQYVLDAFKYNSVDYLLKPIKADQLSGAISKFDRLLEPPDLTDLVDQLKLKSDGDYRTKFLVRVRQKFHSISADNIGYFYSESGSTFLVDVSAKKYILDQSLDQLENQLNPEVFFGSIVK